MEGDRAHEAGGVPRRTDLLPGQCFDLSVILVVESKRKESVAKALPGLFGNVDEGLLRLFVVCPVSLDEFVQGGHGQSPDGTVDRGMAANVDQGRGERRVASRALQVDLGLLPLSLAPGGGTGVCDVLELGNQLVLHAARERVVGWLAGVEVNGKEKRKQAKERKGKANIAGSKLFPTRCAERRCFFWRGSRFELTSTKYFVPYGYEDVGRYSTCQ